MTSLWQLNTWARDASTSPPRAVRLCGSVTCRRPPPQPSVQVIGVDFVAGPDEITPTGQVAQRVPLRQAGWMRANQTKLGSVTSYTFTSTLGRNEGVVTYIFSTFATDESVSVCTALASLYGMALPILITTSRSQGTATNP